MNFLTLALALVVILSLVINRLIKKLRLDYKSKSNGRIRFASLPIHYTYCFILWSVVFAIAIIFTSFSEFVKYLLLIGLIGTNFVLVQIFHRYNFNVKKHIEKSGVALLAVVTGIGILITIAIAVSILFEAIRFFEIVNPLEFFFGTTWNPQMAINAEQSVEKSAFGMIPVFIGTLLVTLIAMMIAIPLGIMAAIHLCFYAKSTTRRYLKPVLEILAGVPTVVYGYFAAVIVAPFFKSFFAVFGIHIELESALAAGFVMGIMIIPFVLSLTDDALNAVPQVIQDGAVALGSTKSEMIKLVAIPTAMPSIVGAVILAVSRAVGETMIVVMAAGLIAKLTFNPLDAVTTATVQIVTLLVGDQEFNSPKTLAAFALALTLFIITFLFNIIALFVIKNYKKKYG